MIPLGYLLFLTTLTLAVVLVLGWFVLDDQSERSLARECNNVALKGRPVHCRASADRSRVAELMHVKAPSYVSASFPYAATPANCAFYFSTILGYSVIQRTPDHECSRGRRGECRQDRRSNTPLADALRSPDFASWVMPRKPLLVTPSKCGLGSLESCSAASANDSELRGFLCGSKEAPEPWCWRTGIFVHAAYYAPIIVDAPVVSAFRPGRAECQIGHGAFSPIDYGPTSWPVPRSDEAPAGSRFPRAALCSQASRRYRRRPATTLSAERAH
jgi:hypothetical protein